MAEKWIRAAVKHPGALRRWAAERGLMTEKGTIDLRRARGFCGMCGLKKKDCHCSNITNKRLTLAETLRKLGRMKA